MFITPISFSQNVYRNQNVNTQPIVRPQYINRGCGTDSVSFSGQVPKLSKYSKYTREQWLVLLSGRMRDNTLSVRMPESELEKEVILEILEYRVKLDEYFKLYEKKARIISERNEIESLREQNPKHPNLPEMVENFEEKYGSDVEDTLQTINKQMDDIKEREREAWEFFEKIDDLEEKLEEDKLLKDHDYKKFWDQMSNKNINKEGQYSTQDLIDIISGKKSIEQPVKPTAVSPVARMNKEQLKKHIGTEYRESLRRNINMYRFISDKEGQEANTELAKAFALKALKCRNSVVDKYREYIVKAGIQNSLTAVFKEVESFYMVTKMEQLGDVAIDPLGVIWKEMDIGIKEMKDFIKQIEYATKRLEQYPTSRKAKADLKQAEEGLNQTKKDWTDALLYSIKHEAINRGRFAEYDKALRSKGKPSRTLEAYDWYTSDNLEINEYKRLAQVCKENNGVLPESEWEKLLAA